MNRRMSDQIIVLEAIGQVRKELKQDMNWIEQGEVMLRLTTLYSLLNVEQLKVAAEQSDCRQDERKVA